MSKWVRLCPKNGTEFLTFRREDFFAAGVGSTSIAGIFLSSLVNPGFFSYLYISITGILFLRALKNGLIPPSEWYRASSVFSMPFFLQEECPHGHSKVSVQLLNGFLVTHVTGETTLLCRYSPKSNIPCHYLRYAISRWCRPPLIALALC